MSGKILVQNLKPLIIGRGSFLGSALTQRLINANSLPLCVDRKQPNKLYTGEQFTKMNVADTSMFEKYLSKTPKIDAVINLAGIRKCKFSVSSFLELQTSLIPFLPFQHSTIISVISYQ